MPECQKINMGALDQYGAERFGRLIFATVRKSVGVKGLNCYHVTIVFIMFLRLLLPLYALYRMVIFSRLALGSVCLSMNRIVPNVFMRFS